MEIINMRNAHSVADFYPNIYTYILYVYIDPLRRFDELH